MNVSRILRASPTLGVGVGVVPRPFNKRGLPSAIVCIGRNYADHIAELGNSRPTEPFFFLKHPSSVLPPAAYAKKGQFERKVLMPKGCDLHYEVELAVVLSKKIDEWNGGKEDLKDVVKGYLVAIDMTSRNYQATAKEKGLPWCLAKGLKTFCPISHRIKLESIPDPQNVQLHLEVNGEKRQEDSTNLMLFDIPRLLRHVSSVMPLYPDDMVLTGTPKGVGRVVPGDKITAGLRVDGKELEEAYIEAQVEERVGGYGSDQAREGEERIAKGGKW